MCASECCKYMQVCKYMQMLQTYASMLCANPHRVVRFKVSTGEIESLITIKLFHENENNKIKN